jgi:hypothetical protein
MMLSLQEPCAGKREKVKRTLLLLAGEKRIVMKCVFKNEQYGVFDDVLSPEHFELLWHCVQIQEHRSVHHDSWHRIWPLTGGDVLRSPILYSSFPEDIDMGPGCVYPSHTAMDLLLESLLAHLGIFEPWVGQEGQEWTTLTACSYLYPPGSGLSWHHDRFYSGAYTFYAHPQWNSDWGGELMIADPACRNWSTPKVEVLGAEQRRSLPAALDNRAESERLMNPGVGSFVLPKPNRLVLLAGGVYHRINPVSPAAGHHLRCSVSGFFETIVPA